MPNRIQPSSRRRPIDPAFIPLPHPSWNRSTPLAELARPLPAAEFWSRLGL